LSITPQRYLAEGHPTEPLFEDEYVCVAWTENLLVGESISIERYLELGHVIVRFGSQRELPAYDEWFLERGDYQRRVEVITTTFNLVPQLLIGTPRIATLHRRLYHFYERYLPLKSVPLPLELPKIEECMQWHKSRSLDPGLMWLRSILRQVAAREFHLQTPK
jgi:DNA-binding transcriptional LysR family regulator